MPLVHVKLIEGVFSDAQKREMIEKITDAIVSIEGEALRPYTWVILEEVKSGDWGMGGKAMTTRMSRPLRAGGTNRAGEGRCGRARARCAFAHGRRDPRSVPEVEVFEATRPIRWLPGLRFFRGQPNATSSLFALPSRPFGCGLRKRIRRAFRGRGCRLRPGAG